MLSNIKFYILVLIVFITGNTIYSNSVSKDITMLHNEVVNSTSNIINMKDYKIEDNKVNIKFNIIPFSEPILELYSVYLINDLFNNINDLSEYNDKISISNYYIKVKDLIKDYNYTYNFYNSKYFDTLYNLLDYNQNILIYGNDDNITKQSSIELSNSISDLRFFNNMKFLLEVIYVIFVLFIMLYIKFKFIKN